MAIYTKNIKLTHNTLDNIKIKESPAEKTALVIRLSAIGSNKDDEIFKIIDDKNIFMIGYSIISINTKSPTDPIAFFIINEYPATEAIASEKVLPTIGIKLSIVNLAVLSVTASIVDAVIPLTVKSPIYTVKINP